MWRLLFARQPITVETELGVNDTDNEVCPWLQSVKLANVLLSEDFHGQFHNTILQLPSIIILARPARAINLIFPKMSPLIINKDGWINELIPLSCTANIPHCCVLSIHQQQFIYFNHQFQMVITAFTFFFGGGMFFM